MADNNLTPKEEFLLNPVTEHNIEDAAVATFETNLKHGLKVTVPITPQQDLHGMPNPYPAGASVNLIPDGTDTENGYVSGYRLNSDGTTTVAADIYVSEYFPINEETTYTWSNRVNGSETPSICFYDENKEFISGIAINRQYSHTFTPPSGAVYCRSSQTTYSFQEANPSTGSAFQLEVGSTATGYRRYSNICPITGISSSFIAHTGANLLSKNRQFTKGYPHNGKVTSSGTYSTYFVPVPKNKRIGFYATTSGVATYYALADGRAIGSNVSGQYTMTNRSNESLMGNNNTRFAMVTMVNYGGFTDNYIRSKQVNIWFDARSTYADPQDNQYITVAFTDPSTGDPMTIYGGSLTLNEDGSADLVCPFGYVEYDGSEDEAWLYETTGFGYKNAYIRPPSDFKSNQRTVDELRCSICDTGTETRGGRTSVAKDKCYISPTPYINFALLDTFGMSSAAEFRAWLQNGHTIQIVGALLNPKTYHFPNVGQLKAFLGQNNIWSDVGNVNVKYLTQNSETGVEWRRDRALELRRRAMIADAPKIHTAIGSSETGGLASFNSYVKAPVNKIEIPFSPKQDLHGYDHPWPAGGGKNLIDPNGIISGAINATTPGPIDSSTIRVVTDYIPVTVGESYVASIESDKVYVCCHYYNSEKAGISTNITDNPFTVPDGVSYARLVFKFPDNSTITPSDITQAQLEKGSTATAYAPYENICPISGWTGANISHADKNLLGGIDLANRLAVVYGNTYMNYDDKTLRFPYSGYATNIDALGVKFKENTQYTFILALANPQIERSNMTIVYTDGSVTYVPDSVATTESIKVVVSTAGKTVRGLGKKQSGGTTYVYYDDSGIFEGVLTAADFSPYVGQILPINWQNDAGTIYGGTVTLNEDGSCDIQPTKAAMDLGSLTWTYLIDGAYPYFRSSRADAIYGYHGITTIVCSNYLAIYNRNYTDFRARDYNNQICCSRQTGYTTVTVQDSRYTDADAFKSAVTGVTIVYDLATLPSPIHFSNLEQLKVWLGENNFWCDISDDITVKYWNRG